MTAWTIRLYEQYQDKWLAHEVGRVVKKHVMLSNSYRDRTSVSDVEEFLEKVEKEFIKAKKRATREGILIRKKYRERVFNEWDNAHYYLSKLDPVRSPEETHYELMHILEKLGWKEEEIKKICKYWHPKSSRDW